MSSSYGSRWPAAPAFIARLASQDVYANPITPLSVIGSGGGGPSNVAPTIPPSIPSTIMNPGSNSIAYNYNVSSVNGTPLATYSSQFASTSTGPWTSPVTGDPVNNFVEATITGLAPETNYYFQTLAQNVAGAVSSAVVLFSTISSSPGPVGPNVAPSIPAFLTAQSNALAVTFNVSSVTGNPTPTYSGLWGATVTPTSSIGATLIGGTTYSVNVSSLAQGTSYYFKSVASNASGVMTSPVSVAISTIGPAGVAPNVAPSVPLFTPSSAGDDTFEYSFNISSVTGNPTPSSFSLIAASHYPSTIIEGVGVTNRTCVPSGLSTGTYSVYSVASNASGTSTSVVVFMSTTGAGGAPSSGGSNISFITATSSNIYFSYDTTGVTADHDQLELEYFIGTTSPPTNERFVAPRQSIGNVISTVATNLSSATNYYIQSYITNAFGQASSATISLFSTIAGIPGVGPSSAPGVPVLVTATTNYINVDVSTNNVTGTPTPSTYIITNGPGKVSTLLGPLGVPVGGNYQNESITGLTSGSVYSVQSMASNATSVSTSAVALLSTLAAAPTAVPTLLGIGFLTYGTGGYSNVILDTSQNVAMGNWQTNGVITYPGAEPSPNGVQYLSTLSGTNNKVIISMGGASSTPAVLSTMFGHPTSYDQGAIDLANSLCYAFFKGPGGASNPLNYASTAWAGYSFEGLDFDIEAATPSTTTLYVFASTLRANPGFGEDKILTTAPQTPYLSQSNGSGLNANGTFASFSEMNAGTNLSAVYTGSNGNQRSLLSPGAGSLIDYHFIQCYNNDAYSYPTGATSNNWNNVVAAWGIQSLQCGFNTINPYPRCIFGFGTTDAVPLYDNAAAIAFNTSISTANSTIRGFSTSAGVLPYSTINIEEWCVGVGFWAANSEADIGTAHPGSTSIITMSTSYAVGSLLTNLPAGATMTYGGVFNSSNWGFSGGVNVPIINSRGY